MALIEKAPPEVGNRAIQSLNGNKEVWGTFATPPDRSHYPHTFLWDGAFVAIVRAQYGDTAQAAQEIREILKGQKKDGLIPNMRFGPGRRQDPERRTFINPESSSDYSQPPLLAQAVLYTAQGMSERDGQAFVYETYPALEGYYDYLSNTRLSGGDSLIAIIHPHETGRDSDPTFDFAKKRLPVPPQGTTIIRGAADKINTVLDYASALTINLRHKKTGWNVREAKEVFWIKDVMFNAIYAQNLQFMAYLAQGIGLKDEASEYSERFQQVEMDILTNMWDEKTQTFRAIKKDGSMISEISVSNLFPLILPNIRAYQLESLVDLLESPDWFNTPYPIPSVPVNSKKFDGSYTEKRLWRGPTWMNMNWYMVEGLIMQRDRFKEQDSSLAMRANASALRIAVASKWLIENEGYREFYNPYTGEGKRVKNFAWSTLGDLISDRIPEMQDFAQEMDHDNHKNNAYNKHIYI